MTIEVNGLGEMALILVKNEVKTLLMLDAALERVLKKVEATAKAEFGKYQPAAAPFPAWPELADATKDERVALGYSENDPLLREGDLRESIEHRKTEPLEGEVGSTDERMPYSEFGTANEPPRSVLGPALYRSKDFIHMTVGAAVVAGFMGASNYGEAGRIHESLGYDFRTED